MRTLSITLLLLAVVAVTSEPLLADEQKPNIIFVLFDDLGWGQPPSYSAESALRTPHLDRLAAQGMRFTDAHSAAAVCTPTRYGVLTGRYPSRIGQFGVLESWSRPIIPRSRQTVASLLKRQGYDTACIGKWHLGLRWEEQGKGSPAVGTRFTEGPVQLGFDYFFGFTHARDIGTLLEQDRVVAHVAPEENQPAMLSKAVEWLDKRDAKRPFFLYFPLGTPHYPVVPASEFIGKSGGVDVAGQSLGGAAAPKRYPDWLYQGDAMLGTLMEWLDKRGLAENTLLIATSDNGAEHREYAPLRESKRSIYEGGHRVPFVARWPARTKAGSTWNHPICLNDLMATAAEIVGQPLAPDAGEDSVSLLDVLVGRTQQPTRDAILHQSAQGDLAIRSGAWKLIFKKNGSRELYNLEADLSETSNIVDQHPELVAQLTQRMQRLLNEGRTTPGEPQPNDVPLSLPTGAKQKQKRNKKMTGTSAD